MVKIKAITIYVIIAATSVTAAVSVAHAAEWKVKEAALVGEKTIAETVKPIKAGEPILTIEFSFGRRAIALECSGLKAIRGRIEAPNKNKAEAFQFEGCKSPAASTCKVRTPTIVTEELSGTTAEVGGEDVMTLEPRLAPAMRLMRMSVTCQRDEGNCFIAQITGKLSLKMPNGKAENTHQKLEVVKNATELRGNGVAVEYTFVGEIELNPAETFSFR